MNLLGQCTCRPDLMVVWKIEEEVVDLRGVDELFVVAGLGGNGKAVIVLGEGSHESKAVSAPATRVETGYCIRGLNRVEPGLILSALD